MAVLALLCVAPSSLLAEDDDATLRVTFDGGDDMFLDPGLVDGVAGDPSWTILANTNNGLLAFKRKPNGAGTELEPDLATRIPTAEDNGRRYTFNVRPGVKFSDDKAGEVTAADVKWSIERALYLDSTGDGRRSLLNIVGAPRAAKLGSASGGISGIEAVDDRTLTIRLREAEPGFLKVLAMPWTFVLPNRTPVNDEGTNGLPATGPYVIRRYEPDRVVQLAKNNNWDQTKSPRDRDLPTRFNRIEVSIGVSPREGLERIRGGEADLTLSPILPSDLKRFAGRPEVQIERARPRLSTVAFFMNTREKPFDDPLVRHAVNVAIDRGRLAAFFNEQAVGTAQVLPPTYPEFRRQSVRNGDIPAALKLIKKAKLTPDELRVTIWSPRDQPVIGVSRYLESVLKDLGFKVRITYLETFVYKDRIGQKDTRAQIGYVSWLATVPDGADIFRLLDGGEIRGDGNPNPSYYTSADTSIDRARATPVGVKRDSAWAAVDAQVSRDVPWVPFANLTKSDMISSRIVADSYVYSPVFGQLWSLMRTK